MTSGKINSSFCSYIKISMNKQILLCNKNKLHNYVIIKSVTGLLHLYISKDYHLSFVPTKQGYFYNVCIIMYFLVFTLLNCYY